MVVNEYNYLWTDRPGLRKFLFMIIYFGNKLYSSLCLGSTIKQVKLKHTNILVKKILRMRLNFNIINMHV